MRGQYKLFLFLILFSLVIPIALSEKIEIKEYVNDYAEIINPEEEAALNVILKQLYDSNEAQYSIVTINSLEGKSLESERSLSL